LNQDFHFGALVSIELLTNRQLSTSQLQCFGTFFQGPSFGSPNADSAPPKELKIGGVCFFSVISINTFPPPRPGLPDFAGVTALLLPGSSSERRTGERTGWNTAVTIGHGGNAGLSVSCLF
jgi:hypothetical protein